MFLISVASLSEIKLKLKEKIVKEKEAVLVSSSSHEITEQGELQIESPQCCVLFRQF